MGKFIGTFNAGGYSVDAFREREIHNGDSYSTSSSVFHDQVRKVIEDERPVCWGGEDRDGQAAMDKEASQVEEWDGVAFGHEGEQDSMLAGTGRRTHVTPSVNCAASPLRSLPSFSCQEKKKVPYTLQTFNGGGFEEIFV